MDPDDRDAAAVGDGESPVAAVAEHAPDVAVVGLEDLADVVTRDAAAPCSTPRWSPRSSRAVTGRTRWPR